MGGGGGSTALSDAVLWRMRVTKQEILFTKIVAKDNESHLKGLTQNIFQLVRKRKSAALPPNPHPLTR